MPTPAEEIKARLDIVEFIQSYVRLQKAGVNYKANCPFHGEKTPSFFVSPARASWHCFGCGKGGDVFQFLMEMEGHSFPEVLNLLAERTGVIIRRENPQARSERGRLGALCESAAQFFIIELGRASDVQNYLSERGLTPETIKNFRIGFAPQSWETLSRALGTKGFTQEEIGKAGLAIKSPERGSWYDRFRSRIMFPIADPSGKVIGFGGRIFEDPKAPAQGGSASGGKYINTPQTPLYDKSSVLYGFDRARQEIRKKNTAVIVEGYMDCVMSHQAGVTHTVAVSGTALTVQQLKILRRLAETLVCSFDADGAGESATRRSLALAAQFDFDRRVAHIPSGNDPADTVREDPAAWARAVETAKPVVEFYTERAFARENPATASGKKAITALLLPFLRELTDEVERAHWIGELSR
ncbi:MAG: DNA primase, partial [Patescibacteria group bacterium]|nr:DNA primase [Patescibacteria group bacterium]